MSSKERLLTAMRRPHVEPDTVPISPRINGLLLREYLGTKSLSTEMWVKAAKEFDFDLHMNPHVSPDYIYNPRIPIMIKGIGVKIEEEKFPNYVIVKRRVETPKGDLTEVTKIGAPHEKGYYTPSPLKTEYFIKGPEDLEKIKYILPQPTKERLSSLETICKTVGENGIVRATVKGPISHWEAVDMYALMKAYYKDKSYLLEVLNLFFDNSMTWAEAILEEVNVDGIFGLMFWEGISAGWSPRVYREIFAPLIKKLVNLTHSYGLLYTHYDDGKLMPILPILVECDVDAVETMTPSPMGDADLAKAKQLYGKDLCLCGYIDLWNIVHEGTPKTIEKAVKEAIEIAAPGGGFILGTSDSIRPGTPLENFKAYFKAGRKYGKYRS